ncbi:MAG: class I SAM-dependent methyltransferase [Saprospiraceae bacterium]|nr:class I SAM-dependent methyltransferase [Saprospiraceae bacterium]
MQQLAYRIRQFLRFYAAADTRYQVHSPLVFDLANALLEDRRWFYAFRDVEAIRARMLKSTVQLDIEDFGAASDGATPIRRRGSLSEQVRKAASSPRKGRLLFRLANWLKPERMLELGTSAGIGALYLASAARQARFISLEGSEALAQVARANLGILGLHHRAELRTGAFRDTLEPALQQLQHVDLVYFDGHHHRESTLAYAEQCLRYVRDHSVLVFDDVYWSAEMTSAWRQIQQHPRVTLTVDLFDLALVFVNPDVKTRQHFRLVPGSWKPWKMR